MASYLHPGVYVLEVGSPPRSIEAASTSTAIFVGDTERGPLTPTRLTSRSDYSRSYGGYLRQDTVLNALKPTLAYAMDAFFGNGGTTCYILRSISPKTGITGGSSTASRANSGVRVNATSPGSWATGTTTQGLHAAFLKASDGSTGRFRIVVAYTPLGSENPINNVQTVVEDWDRLSADPNDENYVVDVLNRSLYVKWDAGTPPAGPTTADILVRKDSMGADQPLPDTTAFTSDDFKYNFAKGTFALTGGNGGETAAAVPADINYAQLEDIVDASLLVIPSYQDDTTEVAARNISGIGYVQTRPLRDLFYIGSMSRQNTQATTSLAVNAVAAEFNSTNPALPKSDFAAVYWPWIDVPDPAGTGKAPHVKVAPAATMAGVYARTDALRGVWKAPAGVEATLLGANSLEFNPLDIHQDILNPLGVNALRVQPGAGAVSWGARTMVPSSQWRYIPVRRMAIFLRKSIYNGIQFAVFEGNDEPLWAALRLTIGGFMDSLYRQGAFAGGSPSEAYFVKCDAETTTATDQVAGVVNILVGFSPLRPAEFVVVKLSQIVSQKG